MAARSTIKRRTSVPPTVTTTSRTTVTTTTVSVRPALCGRLFACHAGIHRLSLTPCGACRCKVQVVVPCRAGIVPFGQINNRPGRSGRSQDSNALPGHFVAHSTTPTCCTGLGTGKSVSHPSPSPQSTLIEDRQHRFNSMTQRQKNPQTQRAFIFIIHHFTFLETLQFESSKVQGC